MHNSISIAFFLSLVLTSCTPSSSNEDIRKCLHHKIQIDAVECLQTFNVRKIKSWKSVAHIPIEDRVYFKSQNVLDYISAENLTTGYPEKPYTAKEDLRYKIQQIKSVLKELPPQIKRHIFPVLLGVFLIENIGSTGFTSIVYDSNKNVKGYFIILDPRKLQRKANTWNTWKENTPFKHGRLSLEVLIEDETKNTEINAIQYILLHEIGHILSMTLEHLPSWEPQRTVAVGGQNYPFSKFSWQKKSISSQKYTPRKAFNDQDHISYYTHKGLGNKKILEVYSSLEKSSFPTLYAATGVHDDYAESFVNYVHVVMLHKKWEVRIFDGKKIRKKVTHCWNQKRCLLKRQFFDNILKVSN